MGCRNNGLSEQWPDPVRKRKIWNTFYSNVPFYKLWDSVLDDIDTEFNIIIGKTFYNLDSYLKIQILLDCSVLLNHDNPVCKDKLLLKQLTQLESQCRRFIYNMHASRYKMLIRVKNRKQSSRVSRSRCINT